MVRDTDGQQLRPVAAWYRPPGADGSGALVVSAIDPGGPVEPGAAPSLSGVDERDLIANLFATLANRPPAARVQRRKPLAEASGGAGMDRDWVAILHLAAYIVLASGLGLSFLRYRRRPF